PGPSVATWRSTPASSTRASSSAKPSRPCAISASPGTKPSAPPVMLPRSSRSVWKPCTSVTKAVSWTPRSTDQGAPAGLGERLLAEPAACAAVGVTHPPGRPGLALNLEHQLDEPRSPVPPGTEHQRDQACPK